MPDTKPSWLWRWWLGIAPGGAEVQLTIHQHSTNGFTERVTIDMFPDEARALIAALVEAADAAEQGTIDWHGSRST